MNTQITQGMRDYAARIQAPEGWTRTELENTWSNGNADDTDSTIGMLTVVLAGEAEKVIFRLEMRDKWCSGECLGRRVAYSGTTQFKTERGWLSFDRRGVSDSFASPYDGPLPDPAQVVAEQLQRVEKFREEDADRIDVPGIGHRITPRMREEYSAQLRAGKTIAFIPSGFGTGLRYSVKKARWATPAAPALAAFFGVPKLYCETVDCD